MMVNPGSPWATLWISLSVGFVLSAVVATVAYRRASLSRGGALAALVAGALTFGFGGPSFGVLLVSFFVSSSLLSHLGSERKRGASREQARGSRRDAWQVVANGGVGAALAVLFYLNPATWIAVAFVGSVAAVTADTWATEVGTLSTAHPRLITTGRRVPSGTSGGVSLLGTLAGGVGAAFIGLAALIAMSIEGSAGGPGTSLWLLPIAVVGGAIGSLADSVMGATAQVGYLCERCGTATERPTHWCGTRTTAIKGLQWANNDVVNFVSSAIGAAVAGAAGILLV